MKTFTATFSTGETVTRNSTHDYRFATGLIGKDGKVRNVTFSASEKPTVNWWGTGVSGSSNYGLSNKQREQANRRNEEIKKNWKVETVKVQS